jgi:hypothetical protein
LDNHASIVIVNHIQTSRRTLTMTNPFLLFPHSFALKKLQCPLALNHQCIFTHLATIAAIAGARLFGSGLNPAQVLPGGSA